MESEEPVYLFHVLDVSLSPPVPLSILFSLLLIPPILLRLLALPSSPFLYHTLSLPPPSLFLAFSP